MNIVVELTIGALLGAIASYVIPLSVDFFILSRSKQLVLGKWLSSWQPKTDHESPWITETLVIKKSFFKGLRFESRNNSAGYDWTGHGNICDRRYITGEWVSTRPGAYAGGALILTIAARGAFMFGYDVAPDEGGAFRYRPFVLARNEEDLAMAREWITKEDESN